MKTDNQLKDMDNLVKEESKEFLLAHEAEEIEKAILQEVEKQQIVQEEIKVSNKKTKAVLVADFIKLQETQGEIIYPESLLKKMNKQDLIKKIAAYTNEKMSNNFPSPSSSLFSDSKTSFENSITENLLKTPVNNTDEMMALALYNMNNCIVKLLEAGCFAMKEKTKGINVLENLSNDVESRREAFLIVFKQIYLEHKDQLLPMLTPLNQYFVLMSQTISTTAIKNISKKKEVKESSS